VVPGLLIGTYSGRGGQYWDGRVGRILGVERDEIKQRFLRGEIDTLVCTDAAAEALNNDNMANAIRSHTVQKGIDPRGFSLVAFGGAGPMHGAAVAEQLQIPEIIIPPYPGITSAVGLLTTDLKYDLIKTEFQVPGRVDYTKLKADLAAIRVHGTSAMLHLVQPMDAVNSLEWRAHRSFHPSWRLGNIPLGPGAKIR
jgi:N-methylhydantoinase A/oxoprolinase/acetone carboxylase beta subunit